MALTAAQLATAAALVARHLFEGNAAPLMGANRAIASVNWTDLQNAISALDSAFGTTLATATTETVGTDTIVQYLASQIPAPVSGGTAQQKTILACYCLLARAGLI